MKSIFLLSFCTLMLGCAERDSVDHRNFAIDTYYPTPNEIQLAEQRARNYWAKHADRVGSNPVYLAVQTSKIFPSERHYDLRHSYERFRGESRLYFGRYDATWPGRPL